jgi:uncharacterized protein (TIGR03435 family)
MPVHALWAFVVVLSAYAQTSQTTAKETGFDVASVRPNNSGTANWKYQPSPGRLSVTNAQLEILLMNALVIQRYQLITSQEWIRTERFDIEATSPDTSAANTSAKLLLLLEDRFKLRFHRETRDVPAFSLLVAGKAGPGLIPAPGDNCIPAEQRSTATGRFVICGAPRMSTTQVSGTKITMKSFATGLAFVMGRPVMDNTGLQQDYDLQLTFVPEAEILAAGNEAKGPSILTALQEQLGLKLQATTTPAEVVVIDNIQRPVEN